MQMLNTFIDSSVENQESNLGNRNVNQSKLENGRLLDKIDSFNLSDLILLRDLVNERIANQVTLCGNRVLPFLRKVIKDDAAILGKDAEMAYILAEIIDQVLPMLTPREEKVIKMRFGLGNSGSKNTLEKVGQHFSLTGERVRQIEEVAMKKLRHPSRLRRMKAFLEGKQ